MTGIGIACIILIVLVLVTAIGSWLRPLKVPPDLFGEDPDE